MTDGARHLHLDVIGGIAGDMFLASALDAAPELLEEVQGVARGIGPGVAVTLEPVKDHGLAGKRLKFALPGKDRGPRHFNDYLNVLKDAAPDAAVAGRACDILERLGRAEAKVHAVALDQVHFHEICDWDSVADILLAALVLERLKVDSSSASPIPKGSGRIQTEHGILPVPAPATLDLLRGFTLIDDGIAGERVTPTGAAILSHLAPQSGLPGNCQLDASGYGFGSKSFDGLANLLRLTFYETRGSYLGDRVGIISFHVDDQTPEDLAIGLANIRSTKGVLDVMQYSALGKKGRITNSMEILCSAALVSEVVAACFLQTTTIGLRVRYENRVLLRRDILGVEVDGRMIQTKQSLRPDGAALVKPEADDIAKAGDRRAREDLRGTIAASLGGQGSAGPHRGQAAKGPAKRDG